jgi:hypothetical protein
MMAAVSVSVETSPQSGPYQAAPASGQKAFSRVWIAALVILGGDKADTLPGTGLC